MAVACFVTLAARALPHPLTEFEALHPKVTFDFVEGSQDCLQEKLLDGRLIVAVMYDRDLTADLERIVLFQPRAYAIRHRAKHQLRDVALHAVWATTHRPVPDAHLRAHTLDRRARSQLLRDQAEETSWRRA